MQQVGQREAGKILVQPRNRDTAAGIFMGLSHVRHMGPDAIAVVLPSDHFVYPEDGFVGAVKAMATTAKPMRNCLVLLGARPDPPEPDYG